VPPLCCFVLFSLDPEEFELSFFSVRFRELSCAKGVFAFKDSAANVSKAFSSCNSAPSVSVSVSVCFVLFCFGRRQLLVRLEPDSSTRTSRQVSFAMALGFLHHVRV
jgi:hypothetical protein